MVRVKVGCRLMVRATLGLRLGLSLWLRLKPRLRLGLRLRLSSPGAESVVGSSTYYSLPTLLLLT